MLNFKSLSLVFIVFYCAVSDAATVKDIAVGRVMIENQSQATQRQAGRAALEQVFVKLSGSVNVVNDPTIKRAIGNYEQYLVASSYLQRADTLMFEARFNQDKIVSLLKSTGMPIWANLRPNATLWFAKQSDDGDIIWFNQNASPEFNQRLQQLSFERGVNIVLPIGDLTDSMSISDFDVWTQNTTKLVAQTTRYNTAFTLSAAMKPITDRMRQQYQEEADFLNQQQELNRLFNTPDAVNNQSSNKSAAIQLPAESDFFQLDWIVSSEQELHIKKAFVASEEDAQALIVNQYADMLAAQYGTSGERAVSLNRSLVSVQNIKSLSDINALQSLLKEMPQVNEVELFGVSGNSANFYVVLNASMETLINLLTLDTRVSLPNNTLEQVSAPDTNESAIVETPKATLVWKR